MDNLQYSQKYTTKKHANGDGAGDFSFLPVIIPFVIGYKGNKTDGKWKNNNAWNHHVQVMIYSSHYDAATQQILDDTPIPNIALLASIVIVFYCWSGLENAVLMLQYMHDHQRHSIIVNVEAVCFNTQMSDEANPASMFTGISNHCVNFNCNEPISSIIHMLSNTDHDII
ncbi:hypothetical protein BATDEDRAFT_24057 [Batrachochytrium dendrobatidis JAM81]|uniref:Uncharacterized protein n=1 Tax=Batrachochytrium dendrobatidis (strain JAM81 / FGSC 10211) TaxID=684364 RepID=F4NZT1_BATDJ|nr:uncharacterized protein BATDEDRAFT_24057 [Batrachochytrium dendrobatidis JAM81]EGF81240.1 hypothetical protein BATDEDRAFT_24057 [Batrachochytrium dendrobatidis JAM81]|eukprot:XP_006677900.1 hypothetical protein BATDEDRAFT_24057 [Batrachochytrium dendrobatidis JAM81]